MSFLSFLFFIIERITIIYVYFCYSFLVFLLISRLIINTLLDYIYVYIELPNMESLYIASCCSNIVS